MGSEILFVVLPMRLHCYCISLIILSDNPVSSCIFLRHLTCRTIRFQQWGVPKIHVISVIASKQGLTELLNHIPDLHVTLGHIDEDLNADGDVLPGLGDSGDRLFGTGPVEEDEEELVHPSKRKRSGSLASENGSNHR